MKQTVFWQRKKKKCDCALPEERQVETAVKKREKKRWWSTTD